MRGLLIAALIVAAAAKSPKNHLLGKVEKRASLPVIASARFVATGATLKAATPDKKKDAFGYNNFRFAKVKSLAKAEATAKAKVAAKANMAPPPNGIVPSSPYEYMSPSGRGFQDANTPFYGHYAGTYVIITGRAWPLARATRSVACVRSLARPHSLLSLAALLPKFSSLLYRLLPPR